MPITRNNNTDPNVILIGETVVYLDPSDDEELIQQLINPEPEQPPSYDYVMGEILSTEILPKYEDLYYDLISYEDVLDEKFWEEKIKIQKDIEFLKNKQEKLYDSYKEYRKLNYKIKRKYYEYNYYSKENTLQEINNILLINNNNIDKTRRFKKYKTHVLYYN